MPVIETIKDSLTNLTRASDRFLELLPYALLLLVLAALFYSNGNVAQTKFAFENSLYLSIAILICTTIFCGSLIGLNRFSPFSIFYSAGLFLTGIVILQLQYLLFAHVIEPIGLSTDKSGIQLFISPLYLASSVIISIFLENQFGKLKGPEFCRAARISFSLSISFFAFLQYFVTQVRSPETLVAIGITLTLSSILASFAAYLTLSHFKDFSSREIRYWSGYALFSGLAVLSTPSFITSNLTKISATEVEFIRLSAFMVLMGSMSLHAARVIANDTRQRNYLEGYNKACDLIYLGTMQINEARSFKMAASQSLELIAEKEKQTLAHLILLEAGKASHYWFTEEDSSFHTLKLKSQQQYIEFGQGFLGKILADRNFSAIENLDKTKPEYFKRRNIALTEGLHSVFAMPVVSDNEVVAILEFFSSKTLNISEQSKSSIHLICRQLANLYKKNQQNIALSYKKDLHQELSDLLPDPFAVFDIDKHLVFHNHLFSTAMEKMGVRNTEDLELSDLLTHLAYKAVTLDEQTSEQAWVDDIFAYFIAPIGYKKIELKNGDWIELSCSRLKNGSFVSVWRDITLPHRQKHELVALNRVFQASTNLASEAMLVFDDDMCLTHFNPQAIEILHLKEDLLKPGLTFSDFLKYFQQQQFLYPELIDGLSKMRLALREEPQKTHSRRIDFGSQIIDLTAEALGNDGFIIVIRENVTQLHGNVIPSTVFDENSWQDLNGFTAPSRVKQPNSNFLTVVSHELLTPLTGIYAANDLLKTTPLSEEQAKHLRIIKKASDELSKLMGDLQDLARIESCNIRLQNEPLKLSELLQKIENQWLFTAQSKGLNFSVTYDAQLPKIVSLDAKRFEQIANTILDNAIKYTSSGGVEFKVSDTSKTDTHRIRVTIKDTGNGIPKEKQKDLFTRFGDLSSFEDLSTGLDGLGLNLCYNLVKLLGGDIGVKSSVGEGSSFWFDVSYQIPDPERQLRPAEVPHTVDDLWEEDSPCLSILVAEDHPVNQLVISELLKKWGHKVDLVDNGELAVAAVATCKYDLVIMDIQMPEMDGITATREIRKFPGRINEIPIIALTAHIEVGERRRCLDAGMNDYLTKPIKKWELRDTLLTYANIKRRGEDVWKLKLGIKERDSNKEPTATNEAAQVFDDNIFKDFINTFSMDVVKSLSEKMLEQYEINHANILSLAAENDWQGVGREAHMIKSSFGQFGLMKAAAFASQIDVDTKAGEKQRVLESAIPLLDLCDEAILILKDKVAHQSIE